jgi:HPt (histidine-containing phosphotransfer) domain-containing protein
MENPQHFNLRELESMAGGDAAFIIKMLETFSYTVPPFIERLKTALSNKNLPDLAHIGHRLKPSFHYLGRPDLNALLAIIENGDGTNKEQDIFSAANKFLSGYAIMMIEVDEYLEKLKQQ